LVFGGSKVQKTKKREVAASRLMFVTVAQTVSLTKKHNGAFGITDQLFLEKIQTSAS